MADLREALGADGLESVRTYIQSGNIVLDSPTDEVEIVAARVRSVIARDVRRSTSRSSRSPLRACAHLAEANPFRASPTPAACTRSCCPIPRDGEALVEIAARQEAVAAKGVSDTVTRHRPRRVPAHVRTASAPASWPRP